MRMLFNKCDRCQVTNLVLIDKLQLKDAINLDILAKF